MTYERITVRPVAGALGAEISGVDLARLDDATFAEIHRAFLDHLAIFFRDQEITPAQQLAFAGRFAPIGQYPFLNGLPDHPQVIEVRKEPEDKLNFGGTWHSDTAYLARPPMGSVLYAKAIPPYGGDTLFANMYLAWEALSDGMKALLRPLRALNTATKGNAAAGRKQRVEENPRDATGVQTDSLHPVARIHPETGRVALYVNLGHTTRFDGMTEAESAPLLDYLFRHQIRPELTCRFRWTQGAVAVWDNRCAQHYAMNDYHGFRRVLHRVTMDGDVPA